MSLQLPAILSPPTPCIPSPALTVSPLEEVAEVALPLYGSASGSGLRSPYASSPLHQAVSCSSLLYLWTGSSSPVASHPAFRRRSFLRLRTASVLSDGDFHPTVGAHSQAHAGARLRREGCRCRVAPRIYSKGAPTDPDAPDSGIRFLGFTVSLPVTIRHCRVNTFVNDSEFIPCFPVAVP